MVPAHYLDDAFIRTKYYMSPRKVTFKKILKFKLINNIIYKFRSITVLQIISITKQLIKTLTYRKALFITEIAMLDRYFAIESDDLSKGFVAPTC